MTPLEPGRNAETLSGSGQAATTPSGPGHDATVPSDRDTLGCHTATPVPRHAASPRGATWHSTVQHGTTQHGAGANSEREEQPSSAVSVAKESESAAVSLGAWRSRDRVGSASLVGPAAAALGCTQSRPWRAPGRCPRQGTPDPHAHLPVPAPSPPIHPPWESQRGLCQQPGALAAVEGPRMEGRGAGGTGVRQLQGPSSPSLSNRVP